MSLANYQKWVEMGKSLGFDGTELVKFVTESQATERAEQTAERDERAREHDRDRERRQQDDKREREKREHDMKQQREKREHEARERELKKRESAKGAKKLKRLESTSSRLSASRAKRLRGQGDVA